MFQYKTKGNVSPQGKRRVYFTCHPDDYKRFFEQISSDILKFTDCAIWYNTDDNYENIDTDLGQMNLFVIPITTRLLTKPCRAINIDVPFALENHIPILPLMQEDSLDELFTRHFGDLQYLNPNAHDITAISYEDKLKKYLNSVLVSDEMAEKVRAAFDAYIFLSYRKKDRKYANELMRLIHQNDFCRDIAIWYDEYLVPGEDFNNAITEALKKSDLFAMVVTPNLVNETNYVQTVEYPEAIKQNKPIIPTELEKTDYKALSEKYPNIPNSIDAYDKVALSDVLHSSLLQIAKIENDNDPQHNFFIGLAYLEGIDVEVNHERALQLITSAAETNEVPEAIEKLVAMYKEGYGVKRDYRVAVEWQQRLVDYWEKEYEKSHNIENFDKFFSVMWDCGSQFLELKYLDLAEKLFLRILEMSESSSHKENESLEDKINLSTVYNNLGKISQSQDNMSKAEQFYLKSLSLREKFLVNESNYLLKLEFLSNSYFHLGNFYKTEGNIEKAETFLVKCLNLTEKLVNETKTDEYRKNLISCYTVLGDICIRQRNYHRAKIYLRKGLSVGEQLVNETENVNDKRILLGVYDSFSEFYKEKMNLYGAKKYRIKCLILSKQLVEETETVIERRNLMKNYGELGYLYSLHGNKKQAEKYLLNALILIKQVLEETSIVEFKCDLSATYKALGSLYRDCKNLDKSEKFYKEAIKLDEQLVTSCSKNARQNLATSYTKLGDLYDDKNDEWNALDFYFKGFSIREKLVEEIGSIKSYEDLADSCFKIGYISESKFYLNKALDIFNMLSRESPIFQYAIIMKMIKKMLKDLESETFRSFYS